MSLAIPDPAPLARRELTEADLRKYLRLHVAAADAAEATITTYLRESLRFRNYLADLGLALPDVTDDAVRGYVATMREGGTAVSTIALRLSVVRRLFDAAVHAGIMPSNPARLVRAPRERRLTGAAAQRTLSVDELGSLITAAGIGRLRNDPTAERDRALIALLAGCGLRSVEVVRLSLADIDLDARTLTAHGKTGDRQIILRGDVTDRLRKVIDRRVREGAGNTDPVFISHGRSEANGRGKRLARRGLRHIVDRLFATAGLIEVELGRRGAPLRQAAPGKARTRREGRAVPTTHGLRATFITLASENGADPAYLGSYVGHSDPRTTRRYTALVERRKKNPAVHLPVEF